MPDKEKFRYATPCQQNEAVEIFIDRGGVLETNITEEEILDFMKDNVTVVLNDKKEIIDLEW
jgi:hypothetical protein